MDECICEGVQGFIIVLHSLPQEQPQLMLSGSGSKTPSKSFEELFVVPLCLFTKSQQVKCSEASVVEQG